MSLRSPRKKARIHFDDEENTAKRAHIFGYGPLQKQREQLPIAKGQ